ncbi:alpha/beta hydrolase [Chryseobacterium sp. T16E-39]|uniref:alpha/beta fold hydrolase n=1 Tax=Chryseobacterium sp. T16E-39 TaxID=2015076 RepID=UPI000B5B0D30|nr:alpha/beta hydrolase [Chryseobacterium sp. T16E-39]ASK31953.1 alpha/beta hydrolase [Chryseobacterium sp. T16E-39]
MKTVKINSVDLCYETFGENNNTTVVLISGLGSQMIRWDEPFCEQLASSGFKVIRFDNRDSGNSVFHAEKEINLQGNIQQLFSTIKKEDIPYSLMDMAKDVIGLLDHLQIEKAHFIGRSMGGIIAQLLGSYFPERVSSLTIIMSTSLRPDLPPTDPEIMSMMTKPPTDPAINKKDYIKEKLDFAKKISGIFPLDEIYEEEIIEKELNRSQSKNGIFRQLLAMGSWIYDPKTLKQIGAPVLIIHGTNDLIFHPDCARDLAQSIPNSELMIIEGMGHSIPPELYTPVCEKVKQIVGRSEK